MNESVNEFDTLLKSRRSIRAFLPARVNQLRTEREPVERFVKFLE